MQVGIRAVLLCFTLGITASASAAQISWHRVRPIGRRIAGRSGRRAGHCDRQ